MTAPARALRRFLSWLCTSTAPAYVQPWDAVIAERHWKNTERLLLGACGPARVELSAAQRARRRQA